MLRELYKYRFFRNLTKCTLFLDAINVKGVYIELPNENYFHCNCDVVCDFSLAEDQVEKKMVAVLLYLTKCFSNIKVCLAILTDVHLTSVACGQNLHL